MVVYDLVMPIVDSPTPMRKVLFKEPLSRPQPPQKRKEKEGMQGNGRAFFETEEKKKKKKKGKCEV
jgi:hypothetical protein